MALLDEVRTSLRVTHTMTDDEISMLISMAFADMARCGVRSELLSETDPSPMVKAAVTCFAKGNYGFDNNEAAMFHQRYLWIVTSLMNSDMNECAEEESKSSDDPTEEDGSR